MVPIRQSLYQVGLFFVLSVLSISILQARQNPSSDHDSKADPTAGRSTFNSSCAGCHGLDGTGSDKAVNIAGSARVRHLSDAQLSSIISNGVPGTGMPAFRSLSARQVGAVVDYLRTLQGKAEGRTLPGDPNRGKEIFFGKGDCSTCHTISGQGGFLGPDLTEHGATSSAEAIRDEIVRAVRVPPIGYRAAVLTTGSGERLEGLVRNEDNFSVQLQTRDGSFHFFKKTDLRSFERQDSSLMPADYRSRLSDAELNDLASYLMTTPSPNKAAPPRKKVDDDE
ncbi:MAG TPA: c-type cytochrome [Candidatus Sulfotelmatobacter sp.]|nr:c-type cytochrome [Candidatus Sulfotelmatobacter sp.]